MANKQSQITITNLQLNALKNTGKCEHSRIIGGFEITFKVELDENRRPVCVGAVVNAEALPLVAFPDMLATNFVVPLPKEKK